MAKEIAGMSAQLHHTFSYAVDIRIHQSSINSINTVFPSYEPMSMMVLLKLAAHVESVNQHQIRGLSSYGYRIVLTPGFTLFYKGDLLRDLVILIEGYAYYDSVTRDDNDNQKTR